MTTIDIILFCYNQEQYIKQALTSVFAQKTDDDIKIRIIVADDCSQDRTLEIIKDMESISSFPIVYLPQEPNMGISKNYQRSFAHTEGNYVAILEGDDYWYENHLMQHIDFLDKNRDYSMSMNTFDLLMEQTGKIEHDNWRHKNSFQKVTLEQQIAEGNQLGNLSACVFRGEYIRQLPEKLFNMSIADWMLGVTMAEYGDIAILKEVTSVYRIKASGVWAGLSRWNQLRVVLKYAEKYDEYQQYRYHEQWLLFRKKYLSQARRNWMYFMPQWVQRTWHKMKGKK